MVFALIDPTSYHTHSSDLDATFTRVATGPEVSRATRTAHGSSTSVNTSAAPDRCRT